jgi:hypothetical protein
MAATEWRGHHRKSEGLSRRAVRKEYIADYSEKCGIVDAKIYRFRVNSAVLRSQHKDWLKDNVAPILAEGGGITLVGEASRIRMR